MRVQPTFSQRSFVLRIEKPELIYEVGPLTWRAQGGCEKATIEVSPSNQNKINQLWDMLEMVRCPVTMTDEKGREVWWGFVNAVTVQAGGWKVGSTLSGMANKVAVLYSYKDGSNEVSAMTDWASDVKSVAEYGTLEYIGSLGNISTQAAAEAKRAALLDLMKKPQSKAERVDPGESSGTLECKGWFYSLDWRAALVAGTNSVNNATQIANMEATFGEFITATDVISTGGVAAPETRTGETTVLSEVLELLELGGANSRRLLATVDMNRRLQIREEEAATGLPQFQMNKLGQVLSRLGQPVPDHLPPVGKYIQLNDVIPGTVDLTKISDPTLQFVEGAEWRRESGLSLQFRGQKRPEDLLKVQR